MEHNLKSFVADFINALQNRSAGADVLKFYHPDVQQTEFPNAVTKNLTVRSLDDLKAASERGKKVLQREEYEVLRWFAFENTAIIEAIWTGTLAIPLGNIPVGGQMKAYFAQFYEFEDGKIIRQRNYDCFEPFA